MKRALFIGRFQPFHNAHLIDIKKILKECDEVIVAIGSSQEKNTLENPFSYKERKEMIVDVLKKHKIKSYKIYPVPDLHNDKKWVAYIKKNLPKHDFVYSGNPWTLRCFKKYDSKVKKIILIKGINSTIVRQRVLRGEEWSNLVPKEVYLHVKKINGEKRIRKLQ